MHFLLTDQSGKRLLLLGNEAISAAGLRSLMCMKHVGLNVASDVLMTLAYVGTRGGMVMVTADDPSMHSSQDEQDNRIYCPIYRPAHAPAVPMPGVPSQGDL